MSKNAKKIARDLTKEYAWFNLIIIITIKHTLVRGPSLRLGGGGCPGRDCNREPENGGPGLFLAAVSLRALE